MIINLLLCTESGVESFKKVCYVFFESYSCPFALG